MSVRAVSTRTSKYQSTVPAPVREALGNAIGHSVLAMITSAGHSRWPLDVPVADLETAGLPAPSVVRMKLFTLDDSLVVRSAGRLAEGDAHAVGAALGRLFGAGS